VSFTGGRKLSKSSEPLEQYPLAEKMPERVRTPTGRPLTDLTVDNVLAGTVTAADIAITPEALRLQAGIARAASRETLARNFERAADLVGVPQAVILEVYELLRPGRAKNGAELRAKAQDMRRLYRANHVASLIDEAAEFYERRGLFSRRY
jgi:propanediol dehydratase small subunit